MDKVTARSVFLNEHVNQGIQNSLDNLMNIYINNETDNEVKKIVKMKKRRKKMTDIMFWQNNTIMGCEGITLTAYGISILLIYKMLQRQKNFCCQCYCICISFGKIFGI